MSGMRLPVVSLAVLPLAAMILAGCSSGGTSQSSSRPATSSTPAVKPSPIPTEYDEEADAAANIDAALGASKRDGKPVLLDFGADWCPDCRVLAKLYQKPGVTRQLTTGYHLVLVDVGEFDTNLDIAARYVNLQTSGIPALAVVRDNNVVYASDKGQFAVARTMKAPQLRAFLKRWAA